MTDTDLHIIVNGDGWDQPTSIEIGPGNGGEVELTAWGPINCTWGDAGGIKVSVNAFALLCALEAVINYQEETKNE